MTTITFDKEFFSATLLTYESKSQSYWQAVGIGDLISEEGEIYAGFLALIGAGSVEIDYDDIGLIKLDAFGTPERFFGPGLFQQDGKLVIKAGANLIPCLQVNRDFQVASWEAELGFREIKTPTATFDVPYLSLEIEGVEYRLDVRTKAEKSAIRAHVKAGKPLAELLDPVPQKGVGGGGEIGKLHELPEGEYPIVRILHLPAKEGSTMGDNFALMLRTPVGGLTGVWVGGNSRKVLSSNNNHVVFAKKLAGGVPLTLVIRGKFQLDQGWSVNHQLLFREPKQIAAPVEVDYKVLNGDFPQELPPPQLQLLQAPVNTKSTPASLVENDNIPF